MAALSFDTLAFAKKLRSYGMEEKQAEGLAEAMSETFNNEVFTKKDAEILKLDIDNRLNSLEKDLKEFKEDSKQRFDKLDTRLMTIIGIVIAQPFALLSIAKLMHITVG